jgi:E3 ubiquitin-protein ligase RAD18
MKLSGLNYALMKETQLRKKLQELGIPSGGNKDAMKRRHQEWLNLWNANLDASEDEQKPKRELLRKLNEWERTRGAGANATEAAVMRKDYDGKSHIHRYKSEFDELIAAAREKRVQRKSNDERESSSQPAPTDADPNADAPEADAHNSHDEPPAENASTKPYEDNESALSKVRGKVQETNLNGTVLPPVSPGRESPSQSESQQQIASASTGMANPFVSPSKRLPMFTLPEDPIIDVENSASAP